MKFYIFLGGFIGCTIPKMKAFIINSVIYKLLKWCHINIEFGCPLYILSGLNCSNQITMKISYKFAILLCTYARLTIIYLEYTESFKLRCLLTITNKLCIYTLYTSIRGWILFLFSLFLLTSFLSFGFLRLFTCFSIFLSFNKILLIYVIQC